MLNLSRDFTIFNSMRISEAFNGRQMINLSSLSYQNHRKFIAVVSILLLSSNRLTDGKLQSLIKSEVLRPQFGRLIPDK